MARAHNPQKAYLSDGRAEDEVGTIYKDWGGRYPVALVYPNMYEIGMSNLGIQSIYGLINNLKGYLCERVFWNGDKVLALESRRPLNDFACVAFSFSYEMDYLSIVPIFKKAEIPLLSAERDDSFPLIIAGGPCMISNPMPIAPFIDAICTGEAEAILPKMLSVLSQNNNRLSTLKRLSEIDGVYVPSVPDPYHAHRVYIKDLDNYPTHSIVLTPNTELGDLFLIEVERGCSHNCRFCMVSHAFCPIRFHSLESLLEQAREGLKVRNRLGLVGPVVTDHPKIYDLLNGILELGGHFSISSLRLSSLTHEMLDLICKGGAQSIAIAPEAGTDILRERIHKQFTEKDIFNACDLISKFPFKHLKLYFMVGLPGEQDSDIEGINQLARECKARVAHNGMRVSINMAPFVPKANTPFQWTKMEPSEIIKKRINKLTSLLGGSGIDIKTESPDWSAIQGILSRGGMEISEVLMRCEKASLAAWRKATKGCSFKDHYEIEEALPWDIITSSQEKEKLLSNYKKSL